MVVFDNLASVDVEVASTELERCVGLSFMSHLVDGRGMLFVFDHPCRQHFTMQRTPISLDMIFMASDGRVISVEEAAPFSTKMYGPDEEAQYVLEVPGGWAQENGVGAGSRAAFVDGEIT